MATETFTVSIQVPLGASDLQKHSLMLKHLNNKYDTNVAYEQNFINEDTIEKGVRVNKTHDARTAAGKELLNLKQKLSHGEFCETVQSRYGFSLRTVQRLIKLYKDSRSTTAGADTLPRKRVATADTE